MQIAMRASSFVLHVSRLEGHPRRRMINASCCAVSVMRHASRGVLPGSCSRFVVHRAWRMGRGARRLIRCVGLLAARFAIHGARCVRRASRRMLHVSSLNLIGVLIVYLKFMVARRSRLLVHAPSLMHNGSYVLYAPWENCKISMLGAMNQTLAFP